MACTTFGLVHKDHLFQRWHDQPVVCHWAVKMSWPHEDRGHWTTQPPTLLGALCGTHTNTRGETISPVKTLQLALKCILGDLITRGQLYWCECIKKRRIQWVWIATAVFGGRQAHVTTLENSVNANAFLTILRSTNLMSTSEYSWLASVKWLWQVFKFHTWCKVQNPITDVLPSVSPL